MLGARTPVTITEWSNFLSKQNAHKTIERTFSVRVNSLLIDIFWSHSALRTKTHSRFPSDKQRHWHWNNIWEYKNRFWCFFRSREGGEGRTDLHKIRDFFAVTQWNIFPLILWIQQIEFWLESFSFFVLSQIAGGWCYETFFFVFRRRGIK